MSYDERLSEPRAMHANPLHAGANLELPTMSAASAEGSSGGAAAAEVAFAAAPSSNSDASSSDAKAGSNLTQKKRAKSIIDPKKHLKNSPMQSAKDLMEEMEDSGANRPVIWDAATLQFNFPRFIVHFLIETLPWPFRLVFALNLPHCGVNLKNHARLFAPSSGSRTNPLAWLFHLYTDLSWVFVVLILTYCTPALPSEEDFKSSPSNIILSIWAVPLTIVFLHRVSVALKFATLTDSEYKRFQKADLINAQRFQNNHMQLASSWSENRDNQVRSFVMQSAAVRVDLDMRNAYYTVEDPTSSREAKMTFMQWQAMLLGRQNLYGLDENLYTVEPDDTREANDKTHKNMKELENSDHMSPEELALVMVKQPDGSYQVRMDRVAAGIINWVEATRMKEGSLVSSGIVRLLATSDHFSEVYPYRLMIRIVATTLILAPWFAFARKSWLTPSDWPEKDRNFYIFSAVFHTCMSGFNLTSVMEFSLALMRDSVRRQLEARLLAEMLRLGEAITDFKVLRLAKDSNGRKRYFNLSSITKDLETKALSEKFPFIPGKLIEGEEYKIGESRQTAAMRMPCLSINKGGRSNIVSWIHMRTMFRHMGSRYKLRMDGITVACFLMFSIVLAVYIAYFSIRVTNRLDPDVQSHLSEASADSPFSVQVITSAFLMVVVVAGNIAEAAKANSLYEQHAHDLSLIRIHVDTEFSSLADTKGLAPNPQTKARMAVLKDLSTSLEIGINATTITDNLLPIKVLVVPANYNLLSKFIFAFGSVGVSIMGLLTREPMPRGSLETAAPV